MQYEGVKKSPISPGSPRRDLLLGSPPDMTTKLEKELKREIDVDGKHYTVTISPGDSRSPRRGTARATSSAGSRS